MTRGTCLIIGAGDGLGAALARAFAREGLTLCLARRARHVAEVEALADSLRRTGAAAHGFGVDAREEAEMIALVDRIEREIGPLEVVVFNIGANVRYGVVETSAQVYRKVWEMAAYAGFLAGREAARVMVPRGRGTILFTGATASMRGGAGFSAFAGGKHALRALSHSMARELHPKGVHVGHVVIDGVIDGEFARSALPDYEARLAGGEIMRPDDIAMNYVHLFRQPKSAWTQEMDLRPWSEKW